MISVLGDKPGPTLCVGAYAIKVFKRVLWVVCNRPQLNLSIRIDRALSASNVPVAGVPPNLLPNFPEAAQYKPSHKRDQ
jgi:hypothetical protein